MITADVPYDVDELLAAVDQTFDHIRRNGMVPTHVLLSPDAMAAAYGKTGERYRGAIVGLGAEDGEDFTVLGREPLGWQ